MKKELKFIIAIIILTIIAFLGLNILKSMNNEKKLKGILNEYDYIIVGSNCSCQSWTEGKCVYTYGIKNGETHELKEEFKEKSDNIHYVQSSYNNGKEYYSLVDDLDEEDKNIFNNIVSIYDEKSTNYTSINQFIVTDKKNYYIHAFDNHKYIVYQYIKDTNTLQELITINTCSIAYFYEK